MPGITEFPRVVREAVDEFGGLFVCEPERRHFAEYLTGLMVAARKTVRGINSEFAVTTDQSCLNRFLTEVKWDELELNQRRLQWLQKDSSTRYGDRGVIAIDDLLIDHYGKFIKDVGWLWDHGEGRKKIAHEYLIANYVCTSGKQELGMGDCQLPDGQGHTRHMYLVMPAYTLLMSQLKQNRAKRWAFSKLTTIGEARRAVLCETMRWALDWAIDQITEYSRSRDHVIAQLWLA